MTETAKPVRVGDVADRIDEELDASVKIVEVARDLDHLVNDRTSQIPDDVRKKLDELTDKLLDASLTIVSSTSANAKAFATMVKSEDG
jgi:regulator of protease activity HflC (stomatin/prohibitin superfamily)